MKRNITGSGQLTGKNIILIVRISFEYSLSFLSFRFVDKPYRYTYSIEIYSIDTRLLNKLIFERTILVYCGRRLMLALKHARNT